MCRQIRYQLKKKEFKAIYHSTQIYMCNLRKKLNGKRKGRLTNMSTNSGNIGADERQLTADNHAKALQVCAVNHNVLHVAKGGSVKFTVN